MTGSCVLEARQRSQAIRDSEVDARARLAAINQLRVSGGGYRFTRAMRGVNRDYLRQLPIRNGRVTASVA